MRRPTFSLARWDRIGVMLVSALAITTPGLSMYLRESSDKPAVRVKVYCFVRDDPSGFVNQRTQDLADSVKDLNEAIAKKKDWLQLADRREEADILLEVMERSRVERKTNMKTQTTKSKDGKTSTSTTTAQTEHDDVVKAVMMVGDYWNELAGVCDEGYMFGGSWRQAAKNLVSSLEDWVKKNHARLQQMKTK